MPLVFCVTGTCRLNYLVAILGTQWNSGNRGNCSTVCNPQCRIHVSDFRRSCQKTDTYQTDQGNEVSFDGMFSTLSLESKCLPWDCTQNNLKHKFCGMVRPPSQLQRGPTSTWAKELWL